MTDYKTFLICVGIGVALGALYGLLNFVKLLFKKKVIVSNIISFLYSLFFGVAILWTIIHFNFGEFRGFLICAFFLGTWIERKTMGKLFAKLYVWLYNKLNRAICTLGKTKLVKKVLK